MQQNRFDHKIKSSLIPLITRTVFVFLALWSIYLNAQIKQVPYKFISQIEEDAIQDKSPSTIAVQYSFIGEYKKAISSYALTQDIRERAGEKEGELKDSEVAYFHSFQLNNAVDYILKKAESEKIIIINEAHHNPAHRVFVQSLIEGLNQRGFNYLGLEALTQNFKDSLALGLDTLLNKRGYPLNSLFTGHYTREPQFANMIRKALKTGFHIFGYEATPFQSGIKRDSAQALNVMKILKKYPNAKILLYCGYAHIVETKSGRPENNYGMSRWLAGYIKDLSGIDPLTINQEVLTERLTIPNSPYYSLIESDTPSVLVNHLNIAFNGPQGFDKYDLLVYHPKTKYIHNRPNWLYRGGAYQPYTIIKDDISLECPCLLKVYNKGETELAVPVDIIEVGHNYEHRTLALPPGNYKIILENIVGERQTMSVKLE